MRHELKTDPAAFAAVSCGAKTHEIRFNDRNFQSGDELLLQETSVAGEMIKRGYPLEYTGREITTTVTHVLEGYGLMPGWVILSITPPEQKGPTAAQRWAKCVELSHGLCDQNGDFVVVQLPALGRQFGSTAEHFVAAIDAEIAHDSGQ